MHKCRFRQFFPLCLICLLLSAGMAQGQSYQGGTNFRPLENKTNSSNYLQPWQPYLTSDKEGVRQPFNKAKSHSSQAVIEPKNQPDSKPNTKQAIGVVNTPPTPDLSGPLFGKDRGSLAEKMGQHTGNSGILPTMEGSMQLGRLGPSFLDGYLLKSLNDKKIGRKKTTEKDSKDDLPKKVKRTL